MNKIVKDDTETIVNEKADPSKETPEKDSVEDIDKDDLDDDLDADDDLDVDDDEVEGAEGRVQLFLDKYGYDSLEDLASDYENLKELGDKVGARDLEKLIADAEYLAKVKEFWKEQDEAKKRETETADETIERLEGKLKDAEKSLKEREKEEALKAKQQEQAKHAARVLKTFNSTVMEEIGRVKDLPKEYLPFLKEYLGVQNPANEINIASKLETRKMAKTGIKKLFDFEQAVIKRYNEGKIQIPKITSSETTPVSKEVQPKNLQEARKTLFETFGIKR